MATWSPISNSVPQFSKNAGGSAASDYYLKFYLSGTTTPMSMATDATAATKLDKCKINSLGYPVNGSDEVFIPHIDQAYKLALYTNATDADNNATGSAAWVVDGLTFTTGGVVSVATLTEEQTATSDGQAVFNLTSITYTPGAKNLGVYRNGVRLPLSAYTETDTDTITLGASEALNIVAGDEFEFIVNERDANSDTFLASNATYQQAGSGAIISDVQTRLRKQILATDYSTLAEAIAAAVNNELIIPAGTYTLSSRLDIDLTGIQDISIKGAGRELTKLVFTGDTVGLDITMENAEYIDGTAVNLEGFSVITSQDRVATAINVNGGHSAGFTATGPVFEKITMRGSDTSTGWAKGLALTDTANTEINNVYYLGKRNDKTTTALEITGTNSPADHIIRGFRATFFEKGIAIAGTVEGVYADSCVLVSGARGVDWNTTGTEPLLNLNNSHINTYEYGVYGVRCNQPFISNNLIYQDPGGVGGSWTGIFLNDSAHAHVSGNTLHGWSVAGSKNGITAGTSCSFVNIDGNIIRAINGSFPITTGVFIDPTASNCTVGNQNIFNNVTRSVDNQSGQSVGISYSDSVVETLTGGAATETLDVAITTSTFSGKPEVAMLTQASGSDQLLARYEYDNAATSNTNVRFTLYTADGSNITARTVRFSLIVAEGYAT